MKAQEPRKDHGDHATRSVKSVTIAISGFVLSVFFILWALLVLVRFYVFDNILYNLFLLCMMSTGNKFDFDLRLPKYFD